MWLIDPFEFLWDIRRVWRNPLKIFLIIVASAFLLSAFITAGLFGLLWWISGQRRLEDFRAEIQHEMYNFFQSRRQGSIAL
jgi:hypothetical protein